MKKRQFAIALLDESINKDVLTVYAETYSSYGGRRTVLRKNMLGQWSYVEGDKRPQLWSTEEGAKNSKALKTLVEMNEFYKGFHTNTEKVAGIVEVFPDNRALAYRLQLPAHMARIFSLLQEASEGAPVQDEAKQLLESITAH